MAQANIRLAAGVSVVAVCLLAGGPSAAVAIADSGHGRSGHSNNGNNGKGSDSSGVGTNSDGAGRPSSKVGSGREAGTSDERPSSNFSPDPSQFKKPKVTFGDGRTPGVQNHDPEPSWRGGAPEPAPPPPPEVITVPLNPPTVSPVREPGVVQRLVVAPTAGLEDPLWGVAGLLLIPAAGAILGYRQARAAHAVAELGRHP